MTSVSFTAAQPEFHRPVAVSVSDDGTTWTEVAQADIYRERGWEQLSVDVPQGRGRYWRVTVYNRNDAPIDGLHARLLTTPRYVVFKQEPGHSYFVLYGNSRATAPVYDFASLTTRASATPPRSSPSVQKTAMPHTRARSLGRSETAGCCGWRCSPRSSSSAASPSA